MPRAKTTEAQVQALVDAVPASGEIPYSDLENALVTSGNKEALTHLFPLKHNGTLKVRTEIGADGKPKTYVSRA